LLHERHVKIMRVTRETTGSKQSGDSMGLWKKCRKNERKVRKVREKEKTKEKVGECVRLIERK
jgi:hypothetical protein